MMCRYGIASWLGAMHAGCGVYMGDPIRLFPEQSKDSGVAAHGAEACILQRTNVSGNVETLASGATGAELMDLTLPDYQSELDWNRGGTSRLHVKLSNAVVYSVSAERNPDYDHWSQTPPCVDHATIEAALDISTEDGKLAEHVDLVQLVAYDDFEAHGTVTIERAAFLGSYDGDVHGPSECFTSLRLRLLVAKDGSHGSISSFVERGACDDGITRPTDERASAHWGTRWTNYGD